MSGWKTYGLCFLMAAAFTLAAAAGVLDRMDRTLADSMYQRRQGTDERIVIVGIDEKALETLGPFQTWKRDVIAEVLEYLNQSEETRPAVIGVDVLFAGETEPDQDRRLAEAAALGGNVVTAVAAQFGSRVEAGQQGNLYMDDFAVLSLDLPYPALREKTLQGHINAMYDEDGIMRHSLLEIEGPDGSRYPLFARTIAGMYRKWEGKDDIKDPPVNGRGFWYLNYSGKPGDYSESISVADLLSGEVPAEYFAGRIVLIGPYAAGLADSYTTAADHARSMYGVEIQANAIHALLEEDYKTEVRDGPQLVVLFVILFLSAVWFQRKKILLSGSVWLLAVGGYLVLCKAAYERGLVLRVLFIPLGLTVFYIIFVAVNYMQAALEKRQMMVTFKRYVAPEIVDEIIRQGTDSLGLGGRLCEIAVLFVDIRGFTSMSEILKPHQVVEILNSYLTLTASCIMKHGGTLDKFIGDAAMAFWGAPLPQEDFVMNAVRTAVAMAEGAKALSVELEERFGRTVSFGIGIHVGPAIVGNVGAEERMDYTAIGDTVNTASRLESNAPGGTIYISRAVADALGSRIRTEPVGTLKLKGKTEGFEVLSLIGLEGEQRGD